MQAGIPVHEGCGDSVDTVAFTACPVGAEDAHIESTLFIAINQVDVYRLCIRTRRAGTDACLEVGSDAVRRGSIQREGLGFAKALDGECPDGFQDRKCGGRLDRVSGRGSVGVADVVLVRLGVGGRGADASRLHRGGVEPKVVHVCGVDDHRDVASDLIQPFASRRGIGKGCGDPAEASVDRPSRICRDVGADRREGRVLVSTGGEVDAELANGHARQVVVRVDEPGQQHSADEVDLDYSCGQLTASGGLRSNEGDGVSHHDDRLGGGFRCHRVDGSTVEQVRRHGARVGRPRVGSIRRRRAEGE